MRGELLGTAPGSGRISHAGWREVGAEMVCALKGLRSNSDHTLPVGTEVPHAPLNAPLSTRHLPGLQPERFPFIRGLILEESRPSEQLLMGQPCPGAPRGDLLAWPSCI